MDREKLFIVIFIALWVAGGIVAGSIFYFKDREKTNTLLSESTTTVVQSQSSTGDLTTIETIPTSTIVGVAASTSTIPVKLLLPYSLTAVTATSTYWPKAWGSVSFKNNDLTLIPDPITHGANSFLNGASAWTNYDVNVDATSLMGGWFDIVARVSNNTQNFVYCEFGSNGTEVIERVNGVDTQLAYSAASTTDITGADENFGIKVYGSDIACMMANQEVVGAQVQNNNESDAGGIGFVIFGQPAAQQGVVLSNTSVSPLKSDTITAPFPLAPIAPAVSPASSTSTSAAPAAPTSSPVAPAALTLPYSTSVFNASDWGQGWGSFSTASGTLMLRSNDSTPGGGIFLNGSNAWTDYKFTAYIQWISGQGFDLVARQTDGGNLLECVFDEADAADTTVSINMISNGQTTTLDQGQTFLDNTAHMTTAGFNVSMIVQGSSVGCELDNQTVSAAIPSGLLTRGGIGFITWDPGQNNSEINVTKISVTPL